MSKNYWKGYLYCMVRDGQHYAYYVGRKAGKTQVGFSRKVASIYFNTGRHPTARFKKDPTDLTKVAGHPHCSYLYREALACFKQYQKPGDRFVIVRVNSKSCPFHVNFLAAAMAGTLETSTSWFHIIPK